MSNNRRDVVLAKAPLYVALLEQFLEGVLKPRAFRDAYIDMWIRDRDAEHDALEPPVVEQWRRLQQEVAKGEITREGFGEQADELFRRSPLSDKIDEVIDALHSTVYHFTDDLDDLRSDPAFFIGLEELKLEARKALATLKNLLRDQ